MSEGGREGERRERKRGRGREGVQGEGEGREVGGRQKNCTIVKCAYQGGDHDCLCAHPSRSHKSEGPFTIIYKREP